MEVLRERVLLSGLERLSCRKAFWAIDVHLNLYWHGLYGRLFDLVLCTQKGWLDDLRREGAPRVAWLPWYGPARDWTPHVERGRAMSFVARVTKHRPTRQWFAELLEQEFQVKAQESRDFAHMLDIYQDTRIAPNETICGEVNFRLFEAAACGCLVLTPPSPGLDELFEPDEEILVFHDAVQFTTLAERLRKRPDQAEALGRAAWERVRAEHLAQHRAERMLSLVLDAPRGACHGPEAQVAFGLTVAAMWEAGRLAMSAQTLLDMLEKLPPTQEVLAVQVRILAGEGMDDRLFPLLAGLAQEETELEERLAAACSLAALHRNDFGLAKVFWYQMPRPARLPEKPESPVDLYRLWARELWRRGLRRRQGQAYDEDRQVPATAQECLLRALRLDPKDLETHRRLDAALADVPGTEPSRLGILSHLALHQPGEWRTHFDLGMTNVKAFRMKEGLSDLLLARDLADKAGAAKHFRLLLSGKDPSGRIAWALAQG